MPATAQELVAVVNGLVSCRMSLGDIDLMTWADGTVMTRAEWREILALTAYVGQCRRKPPGQRKAMRLLRSLLNPEKQRSLKRNRCFYVTSKSGATFRFWPKTGWSERVERHGSRYYVVSRFCLHDPEGLDKIPPADVIIAHLLLISVDEGRFIEMANEHEISRQLWNGEYLRRVREARIEREAAL
jgi:hypothetical protein